MSEKVVSRTQCIDAEIIHCSTVRVVVIMKAHSAESSDYINTDRTAPRTIGVRHDREALEVFGPGLIGFIDGRFCVEKPLPKVIL